MAIKCGNSLLVEITRGTVHPLGTDLLDSIWNGQYLGGIPEIPLEIRALTENGAKVVDVSGAGLITFDRPHGLSVGDDVFVWDMGGLYEAHGDRVVATAPTDKTLTLTLSTDYTQWTGGGLIRQILYGPEDLIRQIGGRAYHLIPYTVEFRPDVAYAISLWQKLNHTGISWYFETIERGQQARVR